jgi:hypothetical protein
VPGGVVVGRVEHVRWLLGASGIALLPLGCLFGRLSVIGFRGPCVIGARRLGGVVPGLHGGGLLGAGAAGNGPGVPGFQLPGTRMRACAGVIAIEGAQFVEQARPLPGGREPLRLVRVARQAPLVEGGAHRAGDVGRQGGAADRRGDRRSSPRLPGRPGRVGGSRDGGLVGDQVPAALLVAAGQRAREHLRERLVGLEGGQEQGPAPGRRALAAGSGNRPARPRAPAGSPRRAGRAGRRADHDDPAIPQPRGHRPVLRLGRLDHQPRDPCPGW